MNIKIKKMNADWRKVVCEANPLAPMLSPEWWNRFQVSISGKLYDLDASEIEATIEREVEGMVLPIVVSVSKLYAGSNKSLPFIPETQRVFVCNLIISSNFAENEIFEP